MQVQKSQSQFSLATSQKNMNMHAAHMLTHLYMVGNLHNPAWIEHALFMGRGDVIKILTISCGKEWFTHNIGN